MKNPSTKPITTTKHAPGFDDIRRRYLRTKHERTTLDTFIEAGWTAEELGEHARIYRLKGYTHPTASSYQMVMSFGLDRAQPALALMRSPDYQLPPFDRPNPEDPEYTDHTDETRADIENLAWCFMARDVRATAYEEGREATYKEARETVKDLREQGAVVPPRFWRRAYRALKEHQGDLAKATVANELWMYA